MNSVDEMGGLAELSAALAAANCSTLLPTFHEKLFDPSVKVCVQGLFAFFFILPHPFRAVCVACRSKTKSISVKKTKKNCSTFFKGCGGGFDFLHSMLLYPELIRRGKQVTILSFSFGVVKNLQRADVCYEGLAAENHLSPECKLVTSKTVGKRKIISLFII